MCCCFHHRQSICWRRGPSTVYHFRKVYPRTGPLRYETYLIQSCFPVPHPEGCLWRQMGRQGNSRKPFLEPAQYIFCILTHSIWKTYPVHRALVSLSFVEVTKSLTLSQKVFAKSLKSNATKIPDNLVSPWSKWSSQDCSRPSSGVPSLSPKLCRTPVDKCAWSPCAYPFLVQATCPEGPLPIKHEEPRVALHDAIGLYWIRIVFDSLLKKFPKQKLRRKCFLTGYFEVHSCDGQHLLKNRVPSMRALTTPKSVLQSFVDNVHMHRLTV